MTMMNICVLQKNDELWCGEAHNSVIPKFVPPLKPEMATVDDVISGIHASRYPWNFTRYEGRKRILSKPTSDVFNFAARSGLPVKHLTVNDVIDEAPEGTLFIDLPNRKVIHLSHQSPESPTFPLTLGVYKSLSDPYARRKQAKCEEEAEATGISTFEADCIGKAFKKYKKPPKGFRMIPIILDHIPEEYIQTDERAIRALIRELQVCDHPSSEFYRSLGGCL